MIKSRTCSVLVLITAILVPVMSHAEPPELVVLRQQYEKLLADRVTKIYDDGVRQLNDSYVGGVDRSIAEAKAAGDLQLVLALETEKKSISHNEAFPTDDTQAVAPLKKLRPIYRIQLAKLDEQRATAQLALITPYVAKLKQVEATLTKADRVEDAKAVLGYRESLGGSPSVSMVGVSRPVTAGEFTNTLGMKFVPVSGINVLFCIHETRRKDYAVFAAEVPPGDSEWKTENMAGVPLEDMDNLPVFGVKYDDAVAYCSWLSKKEGKTYRLPTDREWSYAAGIGHKEKWTKGTTPEMRDHLKAGDFPWGKNFPPKSTDQAGNYGDTSRHEKFPLDPFLSDYTDGFTTLAPVMSFKPNEQGLYDMGGNVCEWVEDWLNSKKAEHVLRGGCWHSSSRDELRTSARATLPGGIGYYHSFGFRVVLEKP